MINLENISFIEDVNGKKAVVISLDKYQEIQEILEEFEDIKTYDLIKNTSDSSELFPVELVEKLVLSDESKIKILREYKKYTVTKLAKEAGISESYLSQIENFKRKGNIELYKKIADILKVDIDMLV
jgi:hypothetical protein